METTKQSEILTPQQVQDEYLIAIPTQYVWKSTNRYGWRDLTIKLGSKVAYRRAALEEWLAARTGQPE